MSEPNWDRLPHDPQRFFGLADGFDRKDLKRQYNQLLKQFKPEKFPAEFQKIRAAYETLDQRLRYGADLAPPPIELPKYEWNTTELTPAATDLSLQPTEVVDPPPSRPLHERVREETPTALAQELRRLDEKQPFHFFALALLEESLPGSDSHVFLKWLLRGLQRWPRDPGLCELLMVYLKQDVAPEQAGSLLRAVAKVIRDDRYYLLTEGLWDVHLRHAPFTEFRATLKACEAQLIDHRITGKLAFCIHILVPAMWLADDDWIDEVLSFINTERARLGWRFEDDLELLNQLRDYVTTRHDVVGDDPIRAEMDRVIRSYCLDPELEFDRKFLACAVKLGSGVDEVLDAFPPRLDVDRLGPLYRLWLWIDREVSNRHGIGDDPSEATKLVKSVRAAFRRIQELSDRTRVGWVWTVSGILYLAVKGTTFVLPCVLLGLLLTTWGGVKDSQSNAGQSSVILGVILGMACGWYLNRTVVTRWWHRFCRYWARICYVKIWRRELLPMLKQTRLPYGDFLEVLQQAEHDEIHCSGWINLYSRIDYGLAFVGLAQRYMV